MKTWVAGFDGIRALAVLLVIFNHKSSLGISISPGGYGVRLFFVLSGFLIISILQSNREKLESGSTSLSKEMIHFYENRLYRIWPPYFLVVFTALFLGMAGVWRPLTGTETLGALTFSSNLFQSYYWSYYPEHIGGLWSVAVEEQFYLWAAPVFLLTPNRQISRVCAAIVALAAVGVVVNVTLQLPSRALYTGSFVNFGFMALGGLAALKFKSAVFAKLAPPALAIFLVAPFAVWWWDIEDKYISLIAPLFAAIALAGIRNSQEGWLVSVLEFPPLRYIGRISYGLYLYHGLVVLTDWGVSTPINGLYEVMLSFLLSALSFRYFETPLLQMKKRLRASVSASQQGHQGSVV